MTNEEKREEEARVVAIMAAILTRRCDGKPTGAETVREARWLLAESRKQVQEGK